MQPEAQRFITDMTELGVEPEVHAELVIYRVTPIDGAHAGAPVETGVGVDELGSWPQVPPHWVHLPTTVRFPQTNSQPSSKSGWSMHSRQISGWGDAPPAVEWVSHIRSVLGEAVG